VVAKAKGSRRCKGAQSETEETRSRLKKGERGKKVDQTTGTEENGEEEGRVGGMRRIEQRDGRCKEWILALRQCWETQLFLGGGERKRKTYKETHRR
jgi:hypothetical protein